MGVKVLRTRAVLAFFLLIDKIKDSLNCECRNVTCKWTRSTETPLKAEAAVEANERISNERRNRGPTKRITFAKLHVNKLSKNERHQARTSKS